MRLASLAHEGPAAAVADSRAVSSTGSPNQLPLPLSTVSVRATAAPWGAPEAAGPTQAVGTGGRALKPGNDRLLGVLGAPRGVVDVFWDQMGDDYTTP